MVVSRINTTLLQLFVDMLRWMMGITSIANINNGEMRARAGVENITEKIREEILRWLGHLERNTEEDIVMRTWKIERWWS